MKFADESAPVAQSKKESVSVLIYHIADPNQWEQAQVSQFYTHPSLHSEGYIHCSTKEQIQDTANHYFADSDEVLVLFIDPARLESELVYESSTRGGEYPHIYGPVHLSAVTGSKKFKKRAKGFRINL
jgi:pyridinium-3,5-bisthiocarboxylic acid mononucleotide nickel chelatase